MVSVQTIALLVPLVGGLVAADRAAAWYLRTRRQRPW